MSDIKAVPEGRRESGSGTIRGGRAAPPKLSATECPIEAMYDEHFNQRQLCADMEMLAAITRPRQELARRILTSLSRDLPAHLEDEERGLFPLLRARALPEDELDETLLRLARERELAQSAFALLIPALACMADGASPEAKDRAALLRLATVYRRHLILENAIILPLARLRLKPEDRYALMAQMRARRASLPDHQSDCARMRAPYDLTHE